LIYYIKSTKRVKDKTNLDLEILRLAEYYFHGVRPDSILEINFFPLSSLVFPYFLLFLHSTGLSRNLEIIRKVTLNPCSSFFCLSKSTILLRCSMFSFRLKLLDDETRLLCSRGQDKKYSLESYWVVKIQIMQSFG
jgi:hypothetical protein